MNDQHVFYLSLGSNIHPETNLPEAIEMLRKFGQIQACSNAWESHAAGSGGPNYLNASVMFVSTKSRDKLKTGVIRPIEAALGRIRGSNQNAPRTIDIDIMMADGKPLNVNRWAYPFVVVPMSDLLPDFIHPTTHQRLIDAVAALRAQTWIVPRPEILRMSAAAPNH
jgi:2-amino-4-hydroxy-6-hydroxymethyldihydropteridine diphosphokinase